MDKLRLSRGLAEGGYAVQRQTPAAVSGYNYYGYQNREGTVILMRVADSTGNVDYALAGAITTKTELDTIWTNVASYNYKPYYSL